MKFIALGKNKLINIASIAQAQYEDKGDQGAKLSVLFLSGVKDVYYSDDARTLWSALQKSVQ